MSINDSKNIYALLLGLPPEITKPDHYQLLGVERFTENVKTIRDAAADQNGKLLTWQNSEYFKDAQELILELVTARDVLLDPERKRQYDSALTNERQLSGDNAGIDLSVIPETRQVGDLLERRLEVRNDFDDSNNFDNVLLRILWGVAASSFMIIILPLGWALFVNVAVVFPLVYGVERTFRLIGWPELTKKAWHDETTDLLDQDVVEELRIAMDHGDIDTIIFHIREVGVLGAKGSSAVPVLIDLLAESMFESVCLEAIHALGEIGSNARAAIPELTRLLGDSSFQIQLEAAEALSKIQT